MALLSLQSSSFTNKPHLLLFKTLPTKPKFTIFCLDSSSSESQSSKPIINNDPIEQSSDKKPISSTGQGFGSTQLPKPSSSTGKKKGKRERASIIRRNPVEKPAFLGKKNGVEEDNQQGVNERAFLLTWLGLGCVILVEGIVLAASGLLPEEWDKFLVKFLYPSFTPTVFLFVAGTVVYGVQKYLQNENAREEK
ncbi:protein LOW PSII ACCUMULATION 2, chloroplastic-like [Chenopodium quinoa]|uniref:protein LOW PSII ACCUMULATION 2, chloroplastic-like n=1 Tax=Chenopodium quinoa TaxID=63459 RepID=UPI000B774481|nr:protein LOW PSII ACCUMULATION 2, chloroplastic-like [Chenopodium quinoa]